MVHVFISLHGAGMPPLLHPRRRHHLGTAAAGEIVDKNGKRLDTYDLKAGKSLWLGVDPPGQMHADVNPGTKPVEVIVVQLKNDRR